MRTAIMLVSLTLMAITTASAQAENEACCKKMGGKWRAAGGQMKCLGLMPRAPAYDLYRQCVRQGGIAPVSRKKKR